MSKKMLPIYIINVLKRYSDEKHHLLIQDIIYYIETDYLEIFERKAISRCIKELQELDYDICYQKGYYLQERQFDKNEIAYLCDQIIHNPMLTRIQSKQLLNKLMIEESNYFKRSITHIHYLNCISHSNNKEFFLTIEIINEAIEKNRKIMFDYMEYGFDRKLHKKREKKYIVNPYDMFVGNERYYLLANYDKYDNLANFRIDKIQNVEIIEELRKPIENLSDSKTYEYPKYKMEHIYMFSGKSIQARIRFKNNILNQIFDWFGLDCSIEKENKDTSILNVKVNENALYYWLKQYDEFVELIK